MAVLGIDKFLKPQTQEPKMAEGGMPEAKEIKTEATATADVPASKPAPMAATAMPKAMPASNPASSGASSTTVKGTPEKVDVASAVTDRDTLDLIDEQNQINALKKNMRMAFNDPEFAKLAGLSEDDVSDFKDSFYERGGFDEKDYNEVVNGYKSIGLSPQSFRKEVSGYPGVESAIKSALSKNEIKALLKDIGISEDALSDKFTTDGSDGGYHEAIDYLLEHIYENGTPEQIQKFGKQLRSSAFNEAASNFVYRNRFKKNKK